jgi:hypothetical protein
VCPGNSVGSVGRCVCPGNSVGRSVRVSRKLGRVGVSPGNSTCVTDITKKEGVTDVTEERFLKSARPHPKKRLGHKTQSQRQPSKTRKKGRSQNSPPHPEKRSVTKLATPSRKMGRSQNSPPHPEKRLGHKTCHPIPKKGSVTKLATPSQKKVGHKTRDLVPEKGSVTKLATASRLSQGISFPAGDTVHSKIARVFELILICVTT